DAGSRDKTVPFANDDDAAVGHREAIRIARPIKTDPLARGNHHVLLDNTALQLCALPHRDTLEEQRILDDGALFYTNVREEDGVSQRSPDDQRARSEHTVDDFRLAPRLAGHAASR